MKHFLLGLLALLALTCAPASADSINPGKPTSQVVTCAACATATKQDTAQTSFTSIDSKLSTLHTDLTAATPAGTNIVGKFGVLGNDGATIASPSNPLSVATHAVTQSGSWVISAGAALIGKVGIDQTTDGVTNRVVTPFTRTLRATFSFTPAASYSAGNNIGGLFTLSTGMNSTPVRFNRINISLVGATITALNGYAALVFPSAPAATITDGATPTFTAADGVLNPLAVNLTGLSTNGETTLIVIGGSPAGTITTDGSGNLKLVLLSSASNTITTPGVCWGWAEILY